MNRRRDDLDGDLLLKLPIHPLGAVDRAHASGANYVQQAIWPELFPRQRHHLCRFGSNLVDSQKCSGVSVCGKQGFDFRPKLMMIVAQLIKAGARSFSGNSMTHASRVRHPASRQCSWLHSLLQAPIEPRPGDVPVATDRGFGDSQHGRDVFSRQARKKAHLNHLGFTQIKSGEFFHGLT